MNHNDFQADELIRHPLSKLELDPNLSVCVISHRSLYDEGCIRFFRFLSTPTLTTATKANVDQQTSAKKPTVWTYTPETAQRYPRSLDSLELSDVHMGDLGFQALIDWLNSQYEGTSKPMFPLTMLRLQFNEIRGDERLATGFISSLSPTPLLSTLVLSNNPLSPSFKQTLFSLLPGLPCLAILHLTMTGLDLSDARALAVYISSGCKLVELHANSNSMGYKGVRAIVRAAQYCWTIERMEMFANDNAGEDEEDSDDGDEWDLHENVSISSREAIASFAIGSGCGWQYLQVKMKAILAQNIFLKRQTAREALLLLKYSRLMLRHLPSPKGAQGCADCDCIPDSSQNLEPMPSPSLFQMLPTEIQLAILSQLAPTLTTKQRLAIFSFASDLRTLPSLRLCLPVSQTQCIPDPGSLAFPAGPGKKSGSLHRDRGCGTGACMGNKSVLCKRETDRQKWLEQVGCDAYDPCRTK